MLYTGTYVCSSVGTIAVQSARLKGYTVYATAGAQNIEYIQKLGAHATFDHKSADVVSQIVARTKKDGVTLRSAHVVVDSGNALQKTLDVLKETKGDDDASARVAHSPLVPEDAPTLKNTEVKFNMRPDDPEERTRHMNWCFNVWLADGLKSGAVVPSPKIKVMPGGLSGLNDALDALKEGVSATKIVLVL